MQNAKCKMQNAKCRMQNAECRINNFGWGAWVVLGRLKNPNDPNASNDPNNPYPHPKIDFRRGFATLGKKVTDG